MFGRTHRPRRIAAIDHTQRIVLRRGGKVHLAHAPLQVESVFVNVPAALQVVAVVSLADLRELSFGEGERHVEEQRQIGARQVVVTEFQVQNPLREAVAPLAGR